MKYIQDIGLIKKIVPKIKSDFKVKLYFIYKNSDRHFDSQMHQFNTRCGLPTLARVQTADSIKLS